MKTINKILIIILVLSFSSCARKNTNSEFQGIEKSPEYISNKVIEEFLTHTDFSIYPSDQFYAVHYAEVCTAFGALRISEIKFNKKVVEQIYQRYLKIITDSIPITGGHVDANVYGILPLELYILTKDERLLKQGLKFADEQWENPLENGMTNQTRYWIDDVYMIGSLQTQAYRATKNEIYLERAALQLDNYIKKLQQANGLFHHGPEAPMYWGRGNGWVAAGMAELLSELPKSNPHYKSIENGYKKMMDALVKYQAEDGMWRQLIDVEEAWNETSSTAMFGFSMAMGTKTGILKDKKYIASYKKAWNSLITYLDEKGRMTEVCIGTGQSKDISYYLYRPRSKGDFHGQAPLLWFAYSILKD